MYDPGSEESCGDSMVKSTDDGELDLIEAVNKEKDLENGLDCPLLVK